MTARLGLAQSGKFRAGTRVRRADIPAVRAADDVRISERIIIRTDNGRDVHGNANDRCERERIGGGVLQRQITIHARRVRIIAVNRHVVRAVHLNQTAPAALRSVAACARYGDVIGSRANQRRSITRRARARTVQNRRSI